VKNKDIDSLIE